MFGHMPLRRCKREPTADYVYQVGGKEMSTATESNCISAKRGFIEPQQHDLVMRDATFTQHTFGGLVFAL